MEILSESNLKRCVAQLEKRIKKNQQDRIRYAEDPEKSVPCSARGGTSC